MLNQLLETFQWPLQMSLNQESACTHHIFKLLPFIITLQTLLKRSTNGKEFAFEIGYEVFEELQPLTVIGSIRKDSGIEERLSEDVLKKVTFKFLHTNATAVKYFIVEENTGVLKTSHLRLDRDSEDLCRRKDVCQLSLDVALHPIKYFQVVKVRVELLDLNDNSPTFQKDQVNISISEASPIGSTYVLPAAFDGDSPRYGIQRYEVDKAFEKLSMVFSESVSGQLEAKLVLQTALDREEQASYQMILKAIDQGTDKHGSMTGVAVVNIIVTDYNDNKPVFTQSRYDTVVYENFPVDSVLLTVQAFDADEGVNGQIEYQLTTDTAKVQGHTFRMKKDTGDLILINHLDREKSGIHQLRVVARDRGEESLSSETEVVVRVKDVNDNEPHITVTFLENAFQSRVDSHASKILIGNDKGLQSRLLSTEVREDALVGSFVAHVNVEDVDEEESGQVVCYSKHPDSPFKLLNSSFQGEYRIILNEKLDRELTPVHYMALACSDKGTLPLTSEVVLQFHSGDVNDNAPKFKQPVYKAVLRENNFRDEDVLQVFAKDLDSGNNGRIDYSLSADVLSYFQIDQRGVISAIGEIDREEVSSFEFVVVASDRGEESKSSTAKVFISIDDSNDEKPIFEESLYEFTLMENSPKDFVVGKVQAIDRDSSKFNTFTYQLNFPSKQFESSLHSDFADFFFSIHPHTGEITSRREFDREQRETYKFSIKAVDDHIPQMSSTAIVICSILDQNDNKPVFHYPSVSNSSFHISDKTPVGHVLKKIDAHDSDSGNNGLVIYKLLNHDKLPFSVDKNSGILKVIRDLSEFNQNVIQLSIEASDMGEVPNTESTHLRIHVNSSIPFILPQTKTSQGNLLSSISGAYTLILVIAVSSILFLVIISSLVCIVLFKQHRKKKRTKHKPGLSFISCDEGYELAANSPLQASSKSSSPSRTTLPCNFRRHTETPTHESYFNGTIAQTGSSSLFNKKYQAMPLQTSLDCCWDNQLSNGNLSDLKTGKLTSPLPPPPPPRSLNWIKPNIDSKANDQSKKEEKVLNQYSESPVKKDQCSQQQTHSQQTPQIQISQQQQHQHSLQRHDQVPSPPIETWQQQQANTTNAQQLWQQRQISNKPTDFTFVAEMPVSSAADDHATDDHHSNDTQATNATTVTANNTKCHARTTKAATIEKKVVFNLHTTPCQLENEFLEYLQTNENQGRHTYQQQNQLLNQQNKYQQQFQRNSPLQNFPNQSQQTSNQAQQVRQLITKQHDTLRVLKNCQKETTDVSRKHRSGEETEGSGKGALDNGDSGIVGGGGEDDGSEDVLVGSREGEKGEKEVGVKGCLGCSCDPESEVSLLERSKIREVSV